MKITFILFCLILLFTGCDFSKQNRAEAAVKELMRSELDPERKYEEVSFSTIQPVTQEQYIQDYLDQKKNKIDTLKKRIKAFEEKYNISIDTLNKPDISMFSQLSEGRKLLKDLEEAEQALKEKQSYKDVVNRRTQVNGFGTDTLYILYHEYKLYRDKDTIGKIRQKNFVLNNRFKVIDVYDNLDKQAIEPLPAQKKFDLE